jgi:hypothetical protein
VLGSINRGAVRVFEGQNREVVGEERVVKELTGQKSVKLFDNVGGLKALPTSISVVSSFLNPPPSTPWPSSL